MMSNDEPNGVLTVQRLLDERLFRRSTVQAGSEHLGAEVRWSEPWSEAQKREGRLDGLVIVADSGAVSPQMMSEMGRRGASALFIRARELFPVNAIDSESITFPVISINADISYVDISEQIGRLSLAFESHVVNYGLSVHRQLADTFHRGLGLDAICYRMAQLGSCTIAIFDPELKIMAFEQGPNSWINPSILGTTFRNIDGSKPVANSEHLEPEITTLHIEAHPMTCVSLPILLGTRQYGWLALVNPKETHAAHDTAERRVLAEHAAPIVGTEILRLQSIEAAEERSRGNFVHALLHGRFTNGSDLATRAEHHEFAVDRRFGVIVAHCVGVIGKPNSHETLTAIARRAQTVNEIKGQTLVTILGDVIVVIRELAQDLQSRTTAGRTPLATYGQDLEDNLRAHSGENIQVTYGRPVHGAENISRSYWEARITLELRAHLGIDSACGFSDLQVHATLLDLAATETGAGYATEILAPLHNSRSSDLEHTVQTFIESGGSINETARRLDLHRNTIVYKINKASSLLQINLRLPENQFAVWLALKLDMLGRISRHVDHVATASSARIR